MPSKYERKRKRDLDSDTTKAGEEGTGNHGCPPSSPAKRSRRLAEKQQREQSPGSSSGGKGGNSKEDSLSIEETNKLRTKLGMAPLTMDNEPPPQPLPGTEQDPEDLPQLKEGEELFTEDGVNIVHKKANNWAQEKESSKLKEKLEVQKQKRQIQSKVFKVKKGLAESDSDDEAASEWVLKSRQLEEQRKKAEQKEKMLNEMDEAFGVGGLVEKERRKVTQPARTGKQSSEGALTAGLLVGHSKQMFADGKETVLVLQDKGVLDEDDEEVLINPNLVENERHKRNIELKKHKSNYQPYEDDEVDEYGQPSKQKMLSKYDEGVDGEDKERETFRLDNTGGYDVDKEAEEEERKRRLLMANKRFETLQSSKLTLAREFYTDEEMISFRRPTKKKDSGKIRKRKALKASDLAPDQEAEETKQEKEARAAKLAARRRQEGGSGDQATSALFKAPIAAATEKLEEGEIEEDSKASQQPEDDNGVTAPTKDKWKSSSGALVDVNKLKKYAEGSKKKEANGVKVEEESEEEEESDEDLVGGVSLAGVVLDDDAEDELGEALERARKIRQAAAKSSSNGGTGVEQVRAMLLSSGALKKEIKQEEGMEVDQEEEKDEEDADDGHIVFDSTSEQYKAIGEIPTFGLAGNRRDGVDFSSFQTQEAVKGKPVVKEKPKYSDVDSDGEVKVVKKEKSRKKSKKTSSSTKKHSSTGDNKNSEDRGSWRVDETGEKHPQTSSSSKSGSNRHKPSSSKHRHQSEDEGGDDEDDDYENVLGEEADVTKGVGAMLKLAGVKGYLEASNRKGAGDGMWKQLLESKRFSKVEQGKYDIEDKTMRKLERMGTTGTGPIRPFADKPDYTPSIEINYSDNKGRVMGSKEAFRSLSWKFHGKGPGKKQIEKHQAKLEKREKLKFMNSSDTPLQTLDKQRNKQEQLGTPYLILSGTGRDTGTTLQKD